MNRNYQNLSANLAKHQRRSRSDAGFTLVEMLVVLAIIGLLAGVVGPKVIGYLSDSKIKAARIQIDSISAALDLFYLDVGRYPTSNENIAALAQRPPGVRTWNGPYLKGGAVPKDPWGNAYVYRSPGQKGAAYDLYSIGPDAQHGEGIVTKLPQ